jgi:hypothetical protein
VARGAPKRRGSCVRGGCAKHTGRGGSSMGCRKNSNRKFSFSLGLFLDLLCLGPLTDFGLTGSPCLTGSPIHCKSYPPRPIPPSPHSALAPPLPPSRIGSATASDSHQHQRLHLRRPPCQPDRSLCSMWDSHRRLARPQVWSSGVERPTELKPLLKSQLPRHTTGLQEETRVYIHLTYKCGFTRLFLFDRSGLQPMGNILASDTAVDNGFFGRKTQRRNISSFWGIFSHQKKY